MTQWTRIILGPVKPRFAVPGLLLIVWFLILLLWGRSSPGAVQPFVGHLFFVTCLIGLPLALRYLLYGIGFTSIETEIHQGQGFVLRGRAAVTMGQRLILFGRCVVLFTFGIAWMAALYEWFRGR